MATDLLCSAANWTTPPGTDLVCGIQAIEACTQTTFKVILPIEACTQTTFKLTIPIEACTTTTFKLLATQACTETTYVLVEANPVEACTATEYKVGIAPTQACVNTTFVLAISVESCTQTDWLFSNPIESCTEVVYWPQDTERLNSCTDVLYILGDAFPTLKCDHVVNLRWLSGELEIDLDPVSVNVSGAQGSFGYTIKISFADTMGWKDLKEEVVRVRADILGVTYEFLIESRTKSIGRASCNYTATGISPTALLTKKYSTENCVSGNGRTIKSVLENLVTPSGFVLDYRIPDASIPDGALIIKKTSPMDAIIAIAKRVGAIVQTSPDGTTVIVEYPYKVATTAYSSQIGINMLTSTDNVESYSSTWQPRDNYDNVIVSSNANKPVKTTYAISHDRPFNNVTVRTVPDVVEQPDVLSSSSNWTFPKQGTVTIEISEKIELIDGKGSLSKSPLDDIVALSYINSDVARSGTLSRDGLEVTNSDTSKSKTVLVTAIYNEKTWLYGILGDDIFVDNECISIYIPCNGNDVAAPVETQSTTDSLVVRGSQENQGVGIFDTLLTTVDLRTGAGRNYLDKVKSDKQNYSVKSAPDAAHVLGDIVFFADYENGEQFYSKITAWTYSETRTENSINIKLEREVQDGC